jgi:nucleoside-diphosphate-sugar epimerase
MESVLITGANGFIGSNLCRYFLGRSFEVFALVRRSSDLHFLEGLAVTLIRGDLASPQSIQLPPRLDYIVHAAAVVSDFASEETAKRNIFDTTANLVSATRDQGIALKRFVYISSTLVLGYGRLNISETNPGLSARFLPYTRAKQEAEAYLREQHLQWGFPVIILRPADVFGPNDRTVSMKLLPAIESGVPPIVGHGNWMLGFCYVENLALACALACRIRGHDGKAYAVTNGQEVTWRRLFGAILQRLGRRQRIYVPVVPLRFAAFVLQLLHTLFPAFEPPLSRYRIRRVTTHSSYDISDTVRDLEYRPDQDFEKQVDSIVDWYLREKRLGYL